jgi:hypothetical protein
VQPQCRSELGVLVMRIFLSKSRARPWRGVKAARGMEPHRRGGFADLRRAEASLRAMSRCVHAVASELLHCVYQTELLRGENRIYARDGSPWQDTRYEP